MPALICANVRAPVCRACACLVCLGLMTSACGGTSIPSRVPGSGRAADRARLLAAFRTRQERQGFSPAIAGCLAHGAGDLPVSTLREGTPPDNWYVHVLTTSRCGPPAVRGFIVAALGRQFAARPEAFPASYRRCLIAGVRALPAVRISDLLVGAVDGRPTIKRALEKIAGSCPG